MFIYLVTNTITGDRYVGKTVQALNKRWGKHQYDACKGSQLIFHRAIRKYGADAFLVEVKGTFDTKAQLDAAEQAAICAYNAHKWDGGYNMTFGGDGASIGNTNAANAPVTDARRRASRNNLTVWNISQTGKRHSEETKAKMRGTRGPQSPEWIAKRVAHRIGRPLSSETRAKIAEARRKNK